VSEATAQKIDAEVRRLVEEGYETAAHPDREEKDFEILAQALLEYETLSGEEITDVINARGRTVNRCWSDRPAHLAVPPAGKPRPRPDPDAGLEPQPQA